MRVYRWAWQVRLHHWLVQWVAGDDLEGAQYTAFAAGWFYAYGKRGGDEQEWRLVRSEYERWKAVSRE